MSSKMPKEEINFKDYYKKLTRSPTILSGATDNSLLTENSNPKKQMDQSNAGFTPQSSDETTVKLSDSFFSSQKHHFLRGDSPLDVHYKTNALKDENLIFRDRSQQVSNKQYTTPLIKTPREINLSPNNPFNQPHQNNSESSHQNSNTMAPIHQILFSPKTMTNSKTEREVIDLISDSEGSSSHQSDGERSFNTAASGTKNNLKSKKGIAADQWQKVPDRRSKKKESKPSVFQPIDIMSDIDSKSFSDMNTIERYDLAATQWQDLISNIGGTAHGILDFIAGDKNGGYWEALVQLIFRATHMNKRKHLHHFVSILNLEARDFANKDMIGNWVLKELALARADPQALVTLSRLHKIARCIVLMPLLIDATGLNKAKLVHIFDRDEYDPDGLGKDKALDFQYLLYVATEYRTQYEETDTDYLQFLSQSGVDPEEYQADQLLYNRIQIENLEQFKRSQRRHQRDKERSFENESTTGDTSDSTIDSDLSGPVGKREKKGDGVLYTWLYDSRLNMEIVKNFVKNSNDKANLYILEIYYTYFYNIKRFTVRDFYYYWQDLHPTLDTPRIELMDAVLKYVKDKKIRDAIEDEEEEEALPNMVFVQDNTESTAGGSLKRREVTVDPTKGSGNKPSKTKDRIKEKVSSSRVDTPVLNTVTRTGSVRREVEEFSEKARQLNNMPTEMRAKTFIPGVIGSGGIAKIGSKDYRTIPKSGESGDDQIQAQDSNRMGLLREIPISDPSHDSKKIELSSVLHSSDAPTQPREITVANSFSDKGKEQFSSVGKLAEKSNLHNSGRHEQVQPNNIHSVVHDHKVEADRVNQPVGLETTNSLTNANSRESKKRKEVKVNPTNPDFTNYNSPTPSLPASPILNPFEPSKQTLSIVTPDSLWENLKEKTEGNVEFQEPVIMAVLVELDKHPSAFITNVVYQLFERHQVLKDNWGYVLINLNLNEESMAVTQRSELRLKIMRNAEGEPVELFYLFAGEVIRQMAKKRTVKPVPSMYSQAFKDLVNIYYDGDEDEHVQDVESFIDPYLVVRLINDADIHVHSSRSQNDMNSDLGKEVIAANKGSGTATGTQQTKISKFFSSPIKQEREGVEINAPKRSNVNQSSNNTQGLPQPNIEKKDNYRQQSGAHNSGSAKGSSGGGNKEENKSESSNKKSNFGPNEKADNNNKTEFKSTNNMNKKRDLRDPGMSIVSSYERVLNGIQVPTMAFLGNVQLPGGDKLLCGSIRADITGYSSRTGMQEGQNSPTGSQSDENGYFYTVTNEPTAYRKEHGTHSLTWAGTWESLSKKYEREVSIALNEEAKGIYPYDSKGNNKAYITCRSESIQYQVVDEFSERYNNSRTLMSTENIEIAVTTIVHLSAEVIIERATKRHGMDSINSPIVKGLQNPVEYKSRTYFNHIEHHLSMTLYSGRYLDKRHHKNITFLEANREREELMQKFAKLFQKDSRSKKPNQDFNVDLAIVMDTPDLCIFKAGMQLRLVRRGYGANGAMWGPEMDFREEISDWSSYDGSVKGIDSYKTTKDWIVVRFLLRNLGLIRDWDDLPIDKFNRLVSDDLMNQSLPEAHGNIIQTFINNTRIRPICVHITRTIETLNCSPDASHNMPSPFSIIHQIHRIWPVKRDGQDVMNWWTYDKDVAVMEYPLISTVLKPNRLMTGYDFSGSSNIIHSTITTIRENESIWDVRDILNVEKVMFNVCKDCERIQCGKYVHAVTSMGIDHETFEEIPLDGPLDIKNELACQGRRKEKYRKSHIRGTMSYPERLVGTLKNLVEKGILLSYDKAIEPLFQSIIGMRKANGKDKVTNGDIAEIAFRRYGTHPEQLKQIHSINYSTTNHIDWEGAWKIVSSPRIENANGYVSDVTTSMSGMSLSEEGSRKRASENQVRSPRRKTSESEEKIKLSPL